MLSQQSVSEGNKEDVLTVLDLLAAAFSSPDGILCVNATMGDRFPLSQSISRSLFLSYNDAYMWSQFANALVVDRQVSRLGLLFAMNFILSCLIL